MTISPLKVEDSRADFEAEFRKQYSFDKHLDLLLEMYNHGTDEEPDIDYYSLAARDAWKWWQASRAAIVIEPPKAEFFLMWDGKKHSTTFREATESYSAILRSAGITVKGD